MLHRCEIVHLDFAVFLPRIGQSSPICNANLFLRLSGTVGLARATKAGRLGSNPCRVIPKARQRQLPPVQPRARRLWVRARQSSTRGAAIDSPPVQHCLFAFYPFEIFLHRMSRFCVIKTDNVGSEKENLFNQQHVKCLATVVARPRWVSLTARCWLIYWTIVCLKVSWKC